MKFAMILFVLLLATIEARASCATMQKLAQEHSNDMARRGLDGSRWLYGSRAPGRACRERCDRREDANRGNRNVVVVAGHAANMRLPGCKAVAHAVGRGVYYWTMVIGP